MITFPPKVYLSLVMKSHFCPSLWSKKKRDCFVSPVEKQRKDSILRIFVPGFTVTSPKYRRKEGTSFEVLCFKGTKSDTHLKISLGFTYITCSFLHKHLCPGQCFAPMDLGLCYSISLYGNVNAITQNIPTFSRGWGQSQFFLSSWATGVRIECLSKNQSTLRRKEK